MDVHPESLLTRVQTIPDPRRREGRRYPFPALLGMLLLGVLHGRDSLRRTWMWASHHWPQVWRPLGAHGSHFPSYQIVRCRSSVTISAASWPSRRRFTAMK
jgi:hypothetical protein